MSDHVYQLVISTLAAITATIGAVSARIAVTKIHEIHLSINSRWDEVRKVIDTEAHARGLTEGKEAAESVALTDHTRVAAQAVAAAVLAAAQTKADAVIAEAKVTAAALVAASAKEAGADN